MEKKKEFRFVITFSNGNNGFEKCKADNKILAMEYMKNKYPNVKQITLI